MAIADRIVVMNSGFIEDVGEPERVYLRPASRFTANFMGENNLIEGRVVAASAGRVTVTTAIGDFNIEGGAAPGEDVALSVRPEHFYLEGGDGRAPVGRAAIIDVGFFGTHHQCTATLDGLDPLVKVRLPQKAIPKAGGQLDLFVDPADLVPLSR